MSRVFLPMKESARRAALATMCPTCGALAKNPCVGTRGNVRTAIHRDRYTKVNGETPA